MSKLSVSTRKVMVCIFWIAAAVLVLNAARIHRSSVRAAVLPKKPIPYTVTLQEYDLKADGTSVLSERSTIAVRADGSRVIDITTIGAPETSLAERIISFASGTKSYIFENKRKKSTTFAPEKYLASHWLADPDNNCMLPGEVESGHQVLGVETVNGYRAVKLSGGDVTRWLALDFGCALVKGRVESSDGQVSEKRLVSLIPGEPSASLFDDPADFQEVPPSQLFGPDAASHDDFYLSHRPTGSSEAGRSK